MLNLFGWAISFTLIIFMTVYQLFVDPDYRRLPLSTFLKPATLISAFKQLKHTPKLPENLDTTVIKMPTVICEPDCQFVINGRRVPALVENNPDDRLENLEVKLFDPKAELIGYQTVNQTFPTFYLIDFQPRLLQVINLNLNQQTLLEFVGFSPTTRQLVFRANHLPDQSHQIFVYSADSPNLIMLSEGSL